jgi:hypothetical protein
MGTTPCGKRIAARRTCAFDQLGDRAQDATIKHEIPPAAKDDRPKIVGFKNSLKVAGFRLRSQSVFHPAWVLLAWLRDAVAGRVRPFPLAVPRPA